MLVYIRDDLNTCEHVPEIDIVIKDQVPTYMQPYDDAKADLLGIQGHI